MNELNGHDIEDLRVGLSATFSKTITEADIVLFAGVSGESTLSPESPSWRGAMIRSAAPSPFAGLFT